MVAGKNEQGGSPGGGGSQAANLGAVRPPVVYLVCSAVGLALHVAWPLRLVPAGFGAPLGAAAIAVAIGLFVAAVRSFRAAGTPVRGSRPSTTVVRTGPYRFSRNPIYLSFSLLQLGLAFWFDSMWVLIMLVPAILVMSVVVIPREESFLEARFPSEYLPYKRAVRRWL